MKISEAVAAIKSCTTTEDLIINQQKIVGDFGFAAFNFLDCGQPHVDVPTYFGTSGQAWEDDYRTNGFVHVDECVARARRTNIPFAWHDVRLPHYDSGPKPGAIKTMEAAYDHGFKDGLVVPYHFRDPIGRPHSALCVFFWKDTVSRFEFLISDKKHELHIAMIYFIQRAVDIVDQQRRGARSSFRPDDTEFILTDRERDILAWAARGKTTADTADILKIAEDTVQTHLRNSMRKLGASNKTHATVKAIYMGLIDV